MFFKKSDNNNNNDDDHNDLVKVASLLIHAAKIDEDYSIQEEQIIKKTLLEIGANSKNLDKLMSNIKDWHLLLFLGFYLSPAKWFICLRKMVHLFPENGSFVSGKMVHLSKALIFSKAN